jgi:hypothetical protein
MKMKLLMESFKKFLKENFQREDYDHALGEVFTALEDIGKPAFYYDDDGIPNWASQATLDDLAVVEINGKTYAQNGGFYLKKFRAGDTRQRRIDPHYIIQGKYYYENMVLEFSVTHQTHIPEKIWDPISGSHVKNPLRKEKRFNRTKHIDNYIVKSVDDAMGLAELIRLDYQALTELYHGKEQ